MRTVRALPLSALLLAFVTVFGPARSAGVQPGTVRNVILVMSDGLRWQEVFTGADERLMNKADGQVEHPEPLRAAYWRDTPEERRSLLMPFLWNTVRAQGQLFGNRERGGDAHVTNGLNFSYPGYSETLCGFADPRIDSNKKIPNPNVTVLEWLNGRPGFGGRVTAFATWDVTPFIINAERSGLLVDDGFTPVTRGTVTPALELLNRLRQETPPRWDGNMFDALEFHSAMEHFKANKPRVFFLMLGETDEWAHEGRYAEYLRAAQQGDAYVRELWETAQAMPEYRGTTTLIYTCDHGRGDGPDWKNHGAKHPGSENIWIAVMGPAVPALGERTDAGPVTQLQIAATLAAAVGEDYGAAQPRAAAVLPVRAAGDRR